MARVLSAWNEHFVHAELPRTLSCRASCATSASRSASATSSRFSIRSTTPTPTATASFVVGRQGITKEDAAAWAAEFRELGQQGRYFFSLNRYLFAAEKPAIS
jgi:hypothetical protein